MEESTKELSFLLFLKLIFNFVLYPIYLLLEFICLCGLFLSTFYRNDSSKPLIEIVS